MMDVFMRKVQCANYGTTAHAAVRQVVRPSEGKSLQIAFYFGYERLQLLLIR